MGNVQFIDTIPNGEPRGLVTIRAADVQPERVRWLWPGRVPFGKLTVLDGDPGLGKSTFTIDLTGGSRPPRRCRTATARTSR
jgi:hypothetical protein